MVTTPKSLKKTSVKPGGSIRSAPDLGRAARAASATTKAKDAKPSGVKVSIVTPVVAEITPSVLIADAEPVTNNVRAGQSSHTNALKKKDLIDRVVTTTGAKKKLVKEIVEATLSVLGDALSKGDMLNIPPFGKAKVSRPQEAGTRNAMTVKVRRTTVGSQGGGQGKAKTSQMLADAEE